MSVLLLPTMVLTGCDTSSGVNDMIGDDAGPGSDSMVDAALPPPAFRPCKGNPNQGGTLWSWVWAGEDYEHATVNAFESANYTRITRLSDLSGNANDYFDSGFLQDPDGPIIAPYTNPSYSWTHPLEGWVYNAPYPPIGLDIYRFDDGREKDVFTNALDQEYSFAADKEFYIAVVLMNTRSNGNRDLLGRDFQNLIKYGSGELANPTTSANTYQSIRITIDGVLLGQSGHATDRRAYNQGPLLIEIHRDSNYDVSVRVNGVDHTATAGMNNNGVFNLKGFGWAGGTGGSQFDDSLFEIIQCIGQTTGADRDETHEYLRTKWELY